MSKSRAGRERVTAAERRHKAIELRKLGLSFQKIADQMGISQSGAHKMVTSALQELNEKAAEGAAEVRRLELERLDEWMLRIAQEIKNGRALGAIDRGLRIMSRRAKLLGLDAPTKMELSEVSDVLFQDIATASQAGNSAAAAALQRIGGGESLLSAWMSAFRQDQGSVVCSPADTRKMTKKELARAAEGRLSKDELQVIRSRAEK